MIDNRFPWIVRPENSPFGPFDRRAMKKLCDRITRRTGRKVAYNRRTKSLYVWHRSIEEGLGWPFKVVRGDGAFKLPDEDEMVTVIHQGQAPRWMKEKWAAQEKQIAKQQEDEAMERIFADAEPDARRELQRRQNRQGMSSKFRPSLLVDGFKK